jgi:CheY-like chemotaxis protein
MNPENTEISLDTMVEWVHEALSHLYDSHELQECHLARQLAGRIADPLLRSQEVRRLLLDSIHSIRPESGVPAQSSDWRSYRIMELRYIKGLNPGEAMAQLAVSKSQFFREQSRALRQVAQALRERGRTQGAPGEDRPNRTEMAHDEAERLLQSAHWDQVDLSRLVGELRPLVEPLASVKHAAVEYVALEGIVLPRADRVMLRQAVLNIITFALDRAGEGTLALHGFRDESNLGLTISARGSGGEASQRTGVGLEVVRRLIGEMGGELSVEDGNPQEWRARLSWRAARPRVLLVVDDNQGFADLFRRFLAVHHWEVVGAADGEAARAEIQRRRPTVILLDVMMPREDGWEFLVGIKAREETRDIPVVICSVLSEPQLAATLGAHAYLTKPVTQQSLLGVLAPWIAGEDAPAQGYAAPPAQSGTPPKSQIPPD